ncbi:uncharacterized protein LOC129600780 [Paramacrobiotus metropolitanus]|uniref:uncharacterized protein LOC129600780 n=1 Tax=Paramacrobiotus metropolitanus TaxID=2943436 RepID=UPI00244658DA|nr:uncharacterized protein LOC129600780 [Paramacrobiotus metropolitanus]
MDLKIVLLCLTFCAVVFCKNPGSGQAQQHGSPLNAYAPGPQPACCSKLYAYRCKPNRRYESGYEPFLYPGMNLKMKDHPCTGSGKPFSNASHKAHSREFIDMRQADISADFPCHASRYQNVASFSWILESIHWMA